MATSSSAPKDRPTQCELSDWEWIRFKSDFDVNNWQVCKPGQRRVGLALVGLGRIGLVHLRNIFREARAKLLYCFDVDHARLDACRSSMYFREFQVKTLNSSRFQEALDDPEVECVIVASPTVSHEHFVRLALGAGKSVLCEKPLTLEQASILSMYDLARDKGVFLNTAFNRHYDWDWQRMRRHAMEGSLGSIHLIKITSRNGQRPSMQYLSVSGNIFYDTAIHDLDMMLWLMRQLPVSVHVVAKTWQQLFKSDSKYLECLSEEELQLAPQIDDYFLAIITMQFLDGSLGLIDISRLSSYGNDQRCEIFGSSAMMKCDGKKSSNVVKYEESGVSNPGINYTFESRYSGAYENELADFLTMAELASGTGAIKSGDDNNNDNNNNLSQMAKHLSDFPRGTLVAAATRLAEICSQAAKSNDRIAISWPDEFRNRFEEEIRL